MIIHQLDQHGEDVPQVPVLVHRGQVVEDGLELVLLHPGSDHDQLLDKVQDKRPENGLLTDGLIQFSVHLIVTMSASEGLVMSRPLVGTPVS